MIFIVNIKVVLLVAQRKASFIASQHNCFQLRLHKKGLKGFLPLR